MHSKSTDTAGGVSHIATTEATEHIAGALGDNRNPAFEPSAAPAVLRADWRWQERPRGCPSFLDAPSAGVNAQTSAVLRAVLTWQPRPAHWRTAHGRGGEVGLGCSDGVRWKRRGTKGAFSRSCACVCAEGTRCPGFRHSESWTRRPAVLRCQRVQHTCRSEERAQAASRSP